MPVAPAAASSAPGHYLPPERADTNLDLEKMVETTDAWIAERTGIQARHIAPDGERDQRHGRRRAGKAALEMAGLKAADLDMIIVGTITPDMPMPATAVHRPAEARRRGDARPSNLSAACAGLRLRPVHRRPVHRHRADAARARRRGRAALARPRLDRTAPPASSSATARARSSSARPGQAATKPRGILSTAIFTDGSLAGALHIPGGGSAEPTTAETVERKRSTCT